MRLNIPIPAGWDETFTELTFEDLAELIAQAQKSRAKNFGRQYTIETPRRVVTITIESRPR